MATLPNQGARRGQGQGADEIKKTSVNQMNRKYTLAERHMLLGPTGSVLVKGIRTHGGSETPQKCLP